MKTKALKGLLFSLILIFCSSTAEASLTANIVSSSQINLTWQINFNNEAGFHILRYNPSTSWQLINIAGANTTSYSNTGLSPNTVYVYAVRAFNAVGYSAWSISSPVVTLPDGDAPSAPQNLTGNAVSSSQINLTWQDNSNNENGFHILRYNTSTSWQLIDVAGANTTSFADTGLSPNTEYLYAMRAFNASGPSVWVISSPVATLSEGDTTPPSVPQNHNASANSCSQVSLSWSASADNPGGSGLKGYYLYRGGSYIKQVSAPATSTIDTGLSGSSTYSYTARAVDNADNLSGISNTAVTNTPSCQVCGNSIVETGEACDDGNSINGDGCENDCTLTPSSSGGETIWADRFGSSGLDKGWAVAVDHQGNFIVTGQFAHDVDFGGGPLNSSSPYQLTSIFVAKYSPNGTHLWSTSLETGPSADSLGRGIAVDSNDNIIIAGSCMEFLTFNGNTLYGWGYNIPDICIAKFSPTGAHLWAKLMGSSGPDEGIGVSVDSNDNVILTGSFSGTVNFGGGPLTSASNNNDIFLVKYSPAGSHLWSKRFGDVTGSSGSSVVVDSNDNILMTGVFSGTVNFGGGQLTSAGSTDAFLLKYSPTGSHLWSKKFGGNSLDGGNSVTVDGIGNVYVTGYFKGTVNFGGGPLTTAGGKDIFIAKYAPTGSHLWSESFGGTYDQEATAIAVDGSSNIIVTGPFRNRVDFGGGPLYTYGYMYSDIFIAKLTPTGGHLWSESFGYGDNDSQISASVAVNSSGNSVVTGYFTGTTDFGTGPLTSDGNNDIFLIKLSP